MRTTVRIDEDLMRDLKEQSQQQGLSLTRFINRVLRQGMSVVRQAGRSPRPYREKTFSMGQPRVDLTKALALAAALEDGELREKLARRK